ncbi:Receptor-like protein 4 [Datura stramonium]|uniref:Receptor-like protein 4 n=1 Tax=Datura stramonium TaxID=4076 RepID=A0ABS8SB91_DATST|nr:Receptor-like protein 4 [Datura stramonium]
MPKKKLTHGSDSVSGDSLSFTGLVCVQDAQSNIPTSSRAKKETEFEFGHHVTHNIITTVNPDSNMMSCPADILFYKGQLLPQAIQLPQPNLADQVLKQSNSEKDFPTVRNNKTSKKEATGAGQSFGQKILRLATSCRDCSATEIIPSTKPQAQYMPRKPQGKGSTKFEYERNDFVKIKKQELEETQVAFGAEMLRFHYFLLFLCFCVALQLVCSRREPYVMRISCGARHDVHTAPTNTPWHKDFAYTGGIPTNGTPPSFITPRLTTLRYFPLSEGPENCYNIKRVPHGHYSVRMFFGLVAEQSFDTEPLFDVSIEGTLVYTLPSGWSNHDDERAFVETLIFLDDGTASLCFHSTGHGDPAILAIEILQVDDRSYYFGPDFGKGTIMRTVKRLSCGAKDSKFDVDYSGDHWGGDRFWNSIKTFGQNSDRPISTKNSIKSTSKVPNFYPESIYQTALLSTDNEPELTYTMDVDPNKKYSVWLHFAEIDPSVTSVGQRVMDILINGDTLFPDVDIVKMAGGIDSALVLNTTVPISGRTLTITLHPTKGTHAIISAIEIFEVIIAESKTLLDEVRGLQSLKNALGLPLRLGWNGDPCVPQQHPWSGAYCQFDKISNKWVIDGMYVIELALRYRSFYLYVCLCGRAYGVCVGIFKYHLPTSMFFAFILQSSSSP